MDAQELEAKRQEALAAGYSDEEIQQYLQTLAQPGQQPQPQQSQQGLGNMNRSAENLGMGQGILGETAKYLAEGYAGKKLILDPLLNAFGNRGGAQPVAPTQVTPQVMPQTVNGPAPTTGNQIRFPTTGGTPAPVTVQQPSMLQQGMDMANKVKQLAMEKLMSGPGLATKAGVGAAALLTSANQNQNYPVPQSGPYRGMEINPMTHRPWTQQELMQFNR